MNIIIITGASKGIGNALAKKYASESYKVYSLARSICLLENVVSVSVDLSDFRATENKFTCLLKEILLEKITSITLVNNAGRLGKIGDLACLEADDISKSIQLNTTTPLILSSLFIKMTEGLVCKKQIINISSGAATKAYQGWSVYCSSKAAIDMMTKVIASEQNEKATGVTSVSIYPGVVDTDMQFQIRNTNASDFSSLQRFVDLKNNKELYSADFVAATIYKLDMECQLKNGSILDIRNLID